MRPKSKEEIAEARRDRSAKKLHESSTLATQCRRKLDQLQVELSALQAQHRNTQREISCEIDKLNALEESLNKQYNLWYGAHLHA